MFQPKLTEKQMSGHLAQVRKFLDLVDPCRTGIITYFQIVHALSNNLQKDWIGLVSTENNV